MSSSRAVPPTPLEFDMSYLIAAILIAILAF
ncbi:hypothetical protein FTUN_2204 [Frigoriglobus tundricola]|uniref:Uncharacterized protein n=1 Tax=Frigoriglobus tundricola TaxID=2774151 RepID=A0A6M5YNY1_9BACT|nr:hypothetical protein FTUN_2204 [Frigoriglobus tundricola]